MNELLKILTEYFSKYHYFIIPAIIYFITIVPVPFPEELFVFGFGYLAHISNYPITIIWLLTFFSVQTSDWLLYYFGFLAQNFSISFFSESKFIKWKLNKGIHYYNKFGVYVVIIARFFFGIRSAVFMASGFMLYPFKKFLYYNFFAGLAHTTFFIFCGYWFSAELTELFNKIFL
ncbi:MAG TPA: hypothetical protein PLM75_11600 [bacterium]|nr:hypothetical protein [bacterium]